MADKHQRARGFSRRLTATVILTVLVVGAAQYVLASRQLTEQVLQQSVDGYTGDAQVLRGLYDPATPHPLAPVDELLGHIASRPGIASALLIDAGGHILVEGKSHHGAGGHDGAMNDEHGPEPAPEPGHEDAEEAHDGEAVALSFRQPVVDAVLDSGTPYAGTELDPAGELLIFAVPVDLGDVAAVLVVEKEGEELARQVSAVGGVLLLTLSLGSIVAVPLFHVLGGRVLRQRHDRALRDSSRDALTGLGNHRSFHEEIRREVEVARRHGHPLSLVMIDLDGFKQVNDHFGHRRGDALLEEVGRILASGRTEDRAFRTGGDEFCIILVSTPASGALPVAEHFRRRIAAEVAGVTASFGIAELGVETPDVESLIQAADAAMYTAKEEGCNRVQPPDADLAVPGDSAQARR